jgi:hypothetical protein
MRHRNAGLRAEQLHGQMGEGADAVGAIVQPARRRLRLGDELGDIRHVRQRLRRDHQQVRLLRQHGDGHEIGIGIIGEARKERLVHRDDALGRDQHGVAIGRGARHVFRSDVPAGAAAVLHHHRLADARLQQLGGRAREDVGEAARGEGHHQPQRPRGCPGRLRARQGRRSQQAGKRRTACDADGHGAFSLSPLQPVSQP